MREIATWDARLFYRQFRTRREDFSALYDSIIDAGFRP